MQHPTVRDFDFTGKRCLVAGNGPGLDLATVLDISHDFDFKLGTNACRELGIHWDFWMSCDQDPIPPFQCEDRFADVHIIRKDRTAWKGWDPQVDIRFRTGELQMERTVMVPAIDFFYTGGCREITAVGLDLTFPGRLERWNATSPMNDQELERKRHQCQRWKDKLSLFAETRWTGANLVRITPYGVPLSGWYTVSRGSLARASNEQA